MNQMSVKEPKTHLTFNSFVSNGYLTQKLITKLIHISMLV